MEIQNGWSSFRLTLLLYTIILVIPLTFYFVYTSFDALKEDTKVIRQIGWIEGTTNSLSFTPSHQFNQQTVKSIDDTLQKISIWVMQNDDSKFYLGGQTLSKDFSDVMTCWSKHKQKLSQSNTSAMINKQSLNCSHSITNLTVIIENMVYLKQNNMINMFYWNLAVAMFLSLLMIYMARTYIHIQIKKHAIHDHETNLFNKKYFLAQLETSCARSLRYNYPLSMLSITIDIFEEGSDKYDKQTKIHILEMLGGLIISLTRTSDTASRYDKNHFLILLPDTHKESALILERRIRETLEKHDFMTSSELKFKFSTTQFNNKETPAECIARAESLLDNI